MPFSQAKNEKITRKTTKGQVFWPFCNDTGDAFTAAQLAGWKDEKSTGKSGLALPGPALPVYLKG